MELYPAIDLRGGRCVRLSQGDYDAETRYGDDPVTVAVRFAEAGARWIHVVDLDAALTGVPVNRDVVGAIAAAVAARNVLVQSGGGVRSVEAAEALWGAGVARVVVGTAAVEQPALVADLARLACEWGGEVAVGLDTRDGEVAVRGWRTGSGLRVEEVLRQLGDTGVAAVIVTDIGRDGMLAGPDLDGLASALAATPLDVIASGGVSSVTDLAALASLAVGDHRLAGAIVGKAIYEGHLTVEEGMAACAASA
jgi:phosphoribosylformimino-5-aminoimidazole carboxamide ribotide isomerase